MTKEKDRLMLDRDVPGEIARLEIAGNPVDTDEAATFTLEADLEYLSKQVKERKTRSRADQKATNTEIKKRMKQAEEDRDKLSERGIAALQYLNSNKDVWSQK